MQYKHAVIIIATLIIYINIRVMFLMLKSQYTYDHSIIKSLVARKPELGSPIRSGTN